jgi:NDP-sugar pyrophosphorylase family protein
LDEKPRINYEVSMGIYMLSKKVLNFIPDNKYFGFDELMKSLVALNQDVAVKSFSGYWLDIGRPDDYIQAIEEFEKMRYKFFPAEAK